MNEGTFILLKSEIDTILKFLLKQTVDINNTKDKMEQEKKNKMIENCREILKLKQNELNHFVSMYEKMN